MNGLVWLFQASLIHEINMLVVKDVFSTLSISSYPPAKYRHEGEKKKRYENMDCDFGDLL